MRGAQWAIVAILVSGLAATAQAAEILYGNVLLEPGRDRLEIRDGLGAVVGELRRGNVKLSWEEGAVSFRFTQERSGESAELMLPADTLAEAPWRIDAPASRTGQTFDLRAEVIDEFTGTWTKEELRFCELPDGGRGEQLWRSETETYQRVVFWRFFVPASDRPMGRFKAVLGYYSIPGEVYPASGCLAI